MPTYITQCPLCPTPQERHDPTSKKHAWDSIGNVSVRPVNHLFVEDKLVSKKLHKMMSARALVTTLKIMTYLNEASVQQDTRAQWVEHSTHDGGGGTVWVVRGLNAKPDCNA